MPYLRQLITEDGGNCQRFTMNSVWHLAISLETLVMKTPGLARAMEASACRAVRQQSATEPQKHKKIYNVYSPVWITKKVHSPVQITVHKDSDGP
jgi:hypothetical protein